MHIPKSLLYNNYENKHILAPLYKSGYKNLSTDKPDDLGILRKYNINKCHLTSINIFNNCHCIITDCKNIETI